MARVLLTYALLVLRVLPALFRSQSEQAIVELVLRSPSATIPRCSPNGEGLRVTWFTKKIKGLHRNDFVMAAKTDRL